MKTINEEKENLKDCFYQKWLEKEIKYKQSKINDINYFALENYICGYAFNNKNEVKLMQLLDTNLNKLELMTIQK